MPTAVLGMLTKIQLESQILLQLMMWVRMTQSSAVNHLHAVIVQNHSIVRKILSDI
jgi:hypothetical protein